MMTLPELQAKFKVLQDEFIQKADRFRLADERLAAEGIGFIDKSTMDEYWASKLEWQLASNQYYTFLQWVRDNFGHLFKG